MEVSTLKKEDANASSGKLNVFIACFTTALARLKLYKELDRLGEQVLYYDTDSVIYSCKPGQDKHYEPQGRFSCTHQGSLISMEIPTNWTQVTTRR